MKRDYSNTELGMLYGVIVGAAVALSMFMLTGEAWWLALTGAGIAFGLGIGASMDTREG